MSSILELNNLSKCFSSDTILDGVDLKIEKGSVLGLLGVNGAGKTTLIKCALGLLKPTQGEAKLFDQGAWELDAQYKQRIGYVPQQFEGFPWMKVKQMLHYMASFYQYWNSEKVQIMLEQWQLSADARIADLSLGQQQRLAIVMALGHDPELLILDEPVASLDPVARRDFIRQLIELNIDEGKTILFSTHIISDVERVAADIAIVKSGSVVFRGDIDTLKDDVVKLHLNANRLLPDHFQHDGVLSYEAEGNRGTIILKGHQQANIDVLERDFDAKINVEKLNLEEIFIALNK